MTNEQVIAALLSTRTRGEAAAALGIAPRTLYDRLHTPGCEELLEEVTGKVLDRAIEAAQTRLVDALDTMTYIMTNDAIDAGTRLKAAQCIISSAARLLEIHDKAAAYELDKSWSL